MFGVNREFENSLLISADLWGSQKKAQINVLRPGIGLIKYYSSAWFFFLFKSWFDTQKFNRTESVWTQVGQCRTLGRIDEQCHNSWAMAKFRTYEYTGPSHDFPNTGRVGPISGQASWCRTLATNCHKTALRDVKVSWSD